MLHKAHYWTLLFSVFISLSGAVKQDKEFEETVGGFTFKIDLPDVDLHPDAEIGSSYIVPEDNQTKEKAKQTGIENKQNRQAINKSKVIPTYTNNVDFYNYEIDWNLTPEKIIDNANQMKSECYR